MTKNLFWLPIVCLLVTLGTYALPCSAQAQTAAPLIVKSVDHTSSIYQNITLINKMGQNVTVYIVSHKGTFSAGLPVGGRYTGNFYGGKRAVCVFDELECIQVDIVEFDADNLRLEIAPHQQIGPPGAGGPQAN